MQNLYIVYVGGLEVNDYYLSKEKAIELSDEYLDDGYDDVEIVNIDDIDAKD